VPVYIIFTESMPFSIILKNLIPAGVIEKTSKITPRAKCQHKHILLEINQSQTQNKPNYNINH